jgi:hypothetical protein
MRINPDLLGALLTIACTLLLALLVALVRVAMRFSKAESSIQKAVEDIAEVKEDGMRARTGIVEMVNSQERRLRFMEEYWIRAGLSVWDQKPPNS